MFRDKHLPSAQLQIVHPLGVSAEVNSTDRAKALYEASKLAIFSEDGLHGSSAERSNVHYLEMGQLPEPSFTEAVRGAVEQEPLLLNQFVRKSAARGADYAPYVAAHLLAHDAHPMDLQPLDVYDASHTIARPERIVSIGAQSERPFYLARMLCRAAGVLPPAAVTETGQLFTRHVLPPYIPCREGEPSITDFLKLYDPPLEHPVPSVQRDLRYLQENTIY